MTVRRWETPNDRPRPPHPGSNRVGGVAGWGDAFASEKNKVEPFLGRQPGVLTVEGNPVAQTANITFDTSQISADALREAVIECGYHCAGESVPDHVCYVEAPHAQPGEKRSPHAVMGPWQPRRHVDGGDGGRPRSVTCGPTWT